MLEHVYGLFLENEIQSRLTNLSEIDCSCVSNKILFIKSVKALHYIKSENSMLANYERKLRNMQDRMFEQSLDLVYFSKIETRFDKNYLQNLLKIEALIQKSVANFYMETKN